jgi:SsrA-binding protein
MSKNIDTKSSPKSSNRVITRNRRANFEYTIEETIKCGVVLEGWEVKSLNSTASASINEAYVKILNGEVFLIGCSISPFDKTVSFIKNVPDRTRKLLLTKREIQRLIGKTQISGYTLIPLNIEYYHGHFKVNVGLAKGKKNYDKRETLKRRDASREIDKAMKDAARYK